MNAEQTPRRQAARRYERRSPPTRSVVSTGASVFGGRSSGMISWLSARDAGADESRSCQKTEPAFQQVNLVVQWAIACSFSAE